MKNPKTKTKKTVIIKAEYIRETKDSLFLDCEGDLEWFPKSNVTFDAEKNELECPIWILKSKFPNENY